MPRVQVLVLLGGIWACIACSCGLQSKPVDQLEISTEVQIPSLLVSEILAAEDRRMLVDAPITLTNHASVAQSIRLAGTGCSCYGVMSGEERIANGTMLEIGPGATRVVNIRAMPPDVQSQKQYTAMFQLPEPNSAGQTDLGVNCIVQVFEDVRLTPAGLTVEVPLGEPQTVSKSVTIDYTYRGDRETDAVPQLERLPEGARVTLVTPEKAYELEPGIWRQSWQADLEVDITADSSGQPRSFLVIMATSEGERIAEQSGQLVARMKSPIKFPGQIQFGRLETGKTASRRIMLAGTEGLEFELKPTQLPAGVEVDLSSESLPRQWVTLKWTPTSAGELTETLEFSTTCAEQPAIRITLTGVVGS